MTRRGALRLVSRYLLRSELVGRGIHDGRPIAVPTGGVSGEHREGILLTTGQAGNRVAGLSASCPEYHVAEVPGSPVRNLDASQVVPGGTDAGRPGQLDRARRGASAGRQPGGGSQRLRYNRYRVLLVVRGDVAVVDQRGHPVTHQTHGRVRIGVCLGQRVLEIVSILVLQGGNPAPSAVADFPLNYVLQVAALVTGPVEVRLRPPQTIGVHRRAHCSSTVPLTGSTFSDLGIWGCAGSIRLSSIMAQGP